MKCDTVQSCKQVVMLQRSMLPASSVSTLKLKEVCFFEEFLIINNDSPCQSERLPLSRNSLLQLSLQTPHSKKWKLNCEDFVFTFDSKIFIL
jgi:hypothetical protein